MRQIIFVLPNCRAQVLFCIAKIKFNAFLCSFVFLLLEFHSFFEPNKHFTLKMYFDIYYGFISLNHKH